MYKYRFFQYQSYHASKTNNLLFQFNSKTVSQTHICIVITTNSCICTYAYMILNIKIIPLQCVLSIISTILIASENRDPKPAASAIWFRFYKKCQPTCLQTWGSLEKWISLSKQINAKYLFQTAWFWVHDQSYVFCWKFPYQQKFRTELRLIMHSNLSDMEKILCIDLFGPQVLIQGVWHFW